MSFVDLLRAITPGQRIARNSASAMRSLDDVAASLPRLDNLAAELPAIGVLRDPAARKALDTTFRGSQQAIKTARDSVAEFARAKGSTEFSEALADAGAADRLATAAARQQLPAFVAGPASEAASLSSRANRGLIQARFAPEIEAQRGIATLAADDLDVAYKSSREASRNLDKVEQPFEDYAKALRQTQRTAEKAADTMKGALSRNVGAETLQVSTDAAARTRQATQALQTLQEGESTVRVAGLVEAARDSLNRAGALGRIEAAPANFAHDVKVARIATTAVAGGGAAALGALYLANRG